MAGALTVFGFALAPPAGATTDAAASEVAGATRYGTAAAAAGEAFDTGTSCAVIATGENFPDVLAAGGLAGAEGCALLLVQQHDVTDETAAAIDDLGVTDATIVGGTGAVGSDVESNLRDDLGLTVDRVAGNDRYETAGKIADRIGASATCYVASGEVAADAQVISAAAFDQKAPVLLVTADDIPSATASRLDGCTDVVIVGGTARITDANQSDIDDASGDTDGSQRLAGTNRQETAVDVANYEKDTLGWGVTCVALVAPRAPSGTVDMSPDALSASQLSGTEQCPELFVEGVDSLGDAAGGFIDDNSATIKTVYKIGGDAAIDDSVADEAVTDAQTTDNDGGATANGTATSRPELVTASIVETRVQSAATATRPAGTYVQYCFDEAINALDATKFFLYNADGTRFTAPAGTQTPVAGQSYTSGIDATNNKCANVFFPALNTAALAANLTLATVDNGAVTGSGGATTDTNIEGDSAVTPTGGSSAAAAAGVTAAPDLVSVGGFRAGSTADVTAVDFTFDQAAFIQNVNGFSLVATDGTTYTCVAPAGGSTTASGQAAPGGEGTTVITVNCAEPASSVQHDATTVARGAVAAGAVATTAGNVSPNPLETADVANGGNTTSPDLAFAAFSPDALPNVDVVGYVFDQDITSTVANGFRIYATDGTETSAVAASRSTDPGGTTTVIAVYPDNTLSSKTYVGANVRPGSVTGTAQGAGTNGADEVGVAPSTTASNTAGKTDGPDLTGVAINAVTSAFGTTTYTATFTFDEDTADTAVVAGPTDNAAGGNNSTGEDVILNLLHLYTPDGLDLVCTNAGAVPGLVSGSTALANRDEDHDNTITCDTFTVGVGGATATTAQVRSAVTGTADYGAVDDEAAGGDTNPEGASLTTGGNGVPAT